MAEQREVKDTAVAMVGALMQNDTEALLAILPNPDDPMALAQGGSPPPPPLPKKRTPDVLLFLFPAHPAGVFCDRP